MLSQINVTLFTVPCICSYIFSQGGLSCVVIYIHTSTMKSSNSISSIKSYRGRCTVLSMLIIRLNKECNDRLNKMTTCFTDMVLIHLCIYVELNYILELFINANHTHAAEYGICVVVQNLNTQLMKKTISVVSEYMLF